MPDGRYDVLAIEVVVLQAAVDPGVLPGGQRNLHRDLLHVVHNTQPPPLGFPYSHVSRDPCICMVLSQSSSACVDGVHTPAKPVCGRHVVGTVVF